MTTRSRYPRRGQRLAPEMLRELLHVGVPEKYLDACPDKSSLELCDLDESAWEQFSDETCRALAQEVVDVVGQAVRTSMAIGARRMPPLPPAVALADLDLEIRTINCLVSAGIHRRPQDLQSMTIDDLLSLRGFWAKSLVDLLVAVESASSGRQGDRDLRIQEPVVRIKHLNAPQRYPRPGHRLAPKALKDILLDTIPDELAADTHFQRARLCDLDETSWEHLPHSSIALLAALIVTRASVSENNRVIQQYCLPKPPRGMRLEDLRLERRTYNCLKRKGFDRSPEQLGGTTLASLMSINAFGPKCLVDLLSSLESVIDMEAQARERLDLEITALAEVPGVEEISFQDPRLGSMLRTMDTRSATIGEFLNRADERRVGLSAPFRLCDQVSQLREEIERLKALSLEEELDQLFAPSVKDRDRQIVAEYYGWRGSGGHTLETLSKKFDLSRERIRQICIKAIRGNRNAVFAPSLDRALRLIAQSLPAPADEIQRELDAGGISQSGTSLRAISQIAKTLCRPKQFEVVSLGHRELAVEPRHAELPAAIVQVTRKVVSNYGVATIADVASTLAIQLSHRVGTELIEVTLQTWSDFCWLDDNHTWFWTNSLPQYGLPHMIWKILSVVDRIEVSKMRSAMQRYRRNGRTLPPAKILLELCRHMPGVRVEDNTVAAEKPLDWREILAGVERQMVEVLKEHGQVMERGAFEQTCISRGVNRFSFNAIIMWSPVITSHGHGVYGLLGATVNRRTLDSIIKQKSTTPSTKVLKKHGMTEDGKPYLAYQLSRSAISGGLVTIPAAMRQQLKGSFTIRVDGGKKVGTLAARNGCGWGLGPLLRKSDTQPGDHLLLIFDLDGREANVRLGDESILDAIDHQKHGPKPHISTTSGRAGLASKAE